MQIRAWERDMIVGKGIEGLVTDKVFLGKLIECVALLRIPASELSRLAQGNTNG